MTLKKLVWGGGGGLQEVFAGWGICSLIEGWKYFKKGGLDKKGVEKNRREDCDPQRNFEVTYAIYLEQNCILVTTSYFMKFWFVKWNTFQYYDFKKNCKSKSNLDPKLCQFLHFIFDAIFDKLSELWQISCIILD